jgi:hypothetical protein
LFILVTQYYTPMKINLCILVFFLSFSSLTFKSCTDKLPIPVLDCSTSPVGYDAVIKSIMDAKCNTAGCHDNNSFATFGDYTTISPSRLEQIAVRVENGEMPPSGDISAASVDSIRCWRESGYNQ